MFKILLGISVLFFLYCEDIESENEFILPEEVTNLDSLTVVRLNVSSVDTVVLHKKVTYESDEEIFIEGYIWDFEVDNKNNVHILSSGPGVVGIYSFDAKGNYLGKMGSFGRGPGEFESISSIYIVNDKLVALDSRLRRFSVFSLASFDLLYDEIVNTELVKKEDTFSTLMNARRIYGQYGENLIISFWSSDFYSLNKFTKERLRLVSKTGIVQKGKSIELEQSSFCRIALWCWISYIIKNGDNLLNKLSPFKINHEIYFKIINNNYQFIMYELY